MRLLVATRSRGKEAEFRDLLAALPFDVVFPANVGLPESPEEDHLEVYDTFEANARAKAEWFARQSGLAVLADDSGLEVDFLGGAPGVLSKRFAGQSGPDHDVTAANNAKLLEVLKGVPDELRTARYRSVLVLLRPDAAELVAQGTTEGTIARALRGGGGFGYDPLFISDDLGMTFGEASAADKHRVSHRARAVAALAAAIAAVADGRTRSGV